MGRVARAAIVLTIAATGCGDHDGGTRSPRSDADPSKYERAKAEAARADQEARAAEAKVAGDALDGLEGR
jgi:hypothetical protein